MFLAKKIFRYIKFITKFILGKELFFFIQKKIPKEFIGSEKYGGWFVYPKNINETSIIYSFGIGEDISFDLDMIKKFNCQIFAFDPTPKSIDWLKKQNLPQGFKYFEYGLAAQEGFIKLFPPKNPNHVSHSIFQKDSQGYIKARISRLKTIMNDLGHDKISILKMDIEGSEYDAIDDILKSNLDIDQILVEFHHRFPQISPQKTKETIKKLNDKGYKIFAISSSKEEYSFIKTR